MLVASASHFFFNEEMWQNEKRTSHQAIAYSCKGPVLRQLTFQLHTLHKAQHHRAETSVWCYLENTQDCIAKRPSH